MIYDMYRFMIVTARPRFLGWVTRAICTSSRITIGRGLKANAIPSINVELNASLRIGRGVEIRKDVEIRAHGTSKVIIEDDVRIDRGVRILAANNACVYIEKGARIGLYSVLNGGGNITVGERSLVSGFVYLQTSMHRHESGSSPIMSQGYSHAGIQLGKDAWLGAHVVVLPGCDVGEHAIVGSNAVVTKSIAPSEVWAGVPAKRLHGRY